MTFILSLSATLLDDMNWIAQEIFQYFIEVAHGGTCNKDGHIYRGKLKYLLELIAKASCEQLIRLVHNDHLHFINFQQSSPYHV